MFQKFVQICIFLMVLVWGAGIGYAQTSWVSQTSGTTADLIRVIFVNSQYVVVENTGTILTSTDGSTWVIRSSGVSNNLCGLTFGGSTYLVAGFNGTILTSTDLATWQSQTSGTPATLFDVIFANSAFITVENGGNHHYLSGRFQLGRKKFGSHQ